MFAKPSPATLVRGLSSGLVVLIFAIFAILAWRGYGDTLQRATDRAQTGANVVAEESRWLVGAVEQALGNVNATIGDTPQSVTADVRADLQAELDALPATLTLAIYDASGRILAPEAGEKAPASIADLPFFAALAASDRVVVRPGSAAFDDGKPNFIVARRLGIGSVPAGFAVIFIDAAVLGQLWTPLALGPDATILLLADDGWVIQRYPSLTEPLNLADNENFNTRIKAADSGSYLAVSQLDGVARVAAFRHIPELGLIATATVSQASTIGQFWYGVFVVLLLLVPIAAALLFGAMWTARILHKLQDALDQNAVLFREVHHRVKNNLQSVSSLVQLQPMDAAIKRDLSNRIEAMSAVHEHLYRSDTFDSVSAPLYLRAVIDGAAKSFPDNVKLIENIGNLTIGKDAAVPLGLVVNEVVTNAFKHGFPEGRKGTISIRLEAAEAGKGKLTITDDGVGFDASQPGKGMGRRLLVGLVRQLGGEFDYVNDGGSTFLMTFPLAGQH